MIQFGTGGWRAIIGDGFTKENIQLLASAMAEKMIREQVQEKGIMGKLKEEEIMCKVYP